MVKKDTKTVKELVDKSVVKNNDAVIDDEDVWAAIESYFAANHILRHQIECFNNSIHHTFHEVTDPLRTIKVEEDGKKYIVEFGRLVFEPPKNTEVDGEVRKIYPLECLHRNITYMGNVYSDVTIIPPTGEPSHYPKVLLGSIPIMVGSDLCWLKTIENDDEAIAKHGEDLHSKGGYYITCGEKMPMAQERILIFQEQIALNTIYVFPSRKSAPKYTLYAEVRSVAPLGIHKTTTVVGFLGRAITVVIPRIDYTAMPIGSVFFALGAKDYEEIAYMILGSDWKTDRESLDFIIPSLEISHERNNKEAALEYIGMKAKKFIKTAPKVVATVEDDVIEEDDVKEEEDELEVVSDELKESPESSYAKYILSHDFLPHLGQDDNDETATKKRIFFALIIRKLISVKLGKSKGENRDHYANKRSKVPVDPQFHSAFRKLVTEVANNIRKNLRNGNAIDILSWIKPTTITSLMVGAITKKKWNAGGAGSDGISPLYERFNYAGGLSNARKSAVYIGDSGKVIAPRDLHGSQFRRIASESSSEGKRCGLIKELALSGYYTIGTDPKPILSIILNMSDGEKIFVTSIENVSLDIKDKIFDQDYIHINGQLVAFTSTPIEFINEFRRLRRKGSLDFEVSIVYKRNVREIKICTEDGRITSPLFIVENGKLKYNHEHMLQCKVGEITWHDLLTDGIIELIDADEEENCLVTTYPSDLNDATNEKLKMITHCELHPSLILGVGGSIIPYPNHNQSPRNTYQASMQKQAIGCPFDNYRQYIHATFHNMPYAQKPLALSRCAAILGLHELPTGINAMTLIMPRPFNEEDSVELNSSSLDNGFMVTYYRKCHYVEIHPEQNQKLGIPLEKECINCKGNTSSLDEDGIIGVGMHVKKGDVLIGVLHKSMAVVAASKSGKMYIDNSIVYDHIEPAVIETVQVGTTGSGYPYVRVMTCQKRRPMIGDKFCFDINHEVLTTDGWVRIDKVKKTHKVASMNAKHELLYENPTDIMAFDHDGDMVEIKNRSLSFLVTPNHNMYVCKKGNNATYELIQADQLFGVPVYYKKDAIWTALGLQSIELETKTARSFCQRQKDELSFSVDEWLYIVGIWITEGTYDDSSVMFSINKERVKSKLTECLKFLKIEYKIYKNYMLAIRDKQILNYFMTNFERGFLNKKLPEWVWKLNVHQCNILLNGMMLDYTKGNVRTYYTSSLQLKEGITRLALHAGISTSSCLIKGKTWVIKLLICQHPSVNMYKKKDEQKYVPFKGKVYCCTVPHGLLYARRIFKKKSTLQLPAWVGNSARHGFSGSF